MSPPTGCASAEWKPDPDKLVHLLRLWCARYQDSDLASKTTQIFEMWGNQHPGWKPVKTPGKQEEKMAGLRDFPGQLSRVQDCLAPPPGNGKTQGRVEVQIETYGKLRGALVEKIAELENRIRPILEPRPTDPSAGQGERPEPHGMAQALELANYQLEQSIHWLDSIIARVEL